MMEQLASLFDEEETKEVRTARGKKAAAAAKSGRRAA